MNFLDQGIRTFDRSVKNALSFVDNSEYISAGLTIFLILYAGLAAPQLPEYIANLFDNPLFKLLILFLVAYSAKKNPTVAIVAAIGLMVSIHTLNRIKLNKGLLAMISLQEQNGGNASNSNGENIENGVPEEAVMAEGFAQSEIPEDALSGLAEGEAESQGSCGRTANFRNSFYPQYVNMKPDAYMARYTGNDVGGFDPNSTYASI